MYSILNSNFLKYYNKLKHYEDLSKYATLAIWTTGSDSTITDLIGDEPKLEEVEEVKRELTESDMEWIKFAEDNNLSYKITQNGIKVG